MRPCDVVGRRGMGSSPCEAEVIVFCEDRETSSALNALVSEVQGGVRPLVVWLGAGASTWVGYPLWRDLAETMHRRFGREVVDYRKNEATALLSEARYPALFQEMRDSDSTLYFSCLRDAFAYQPPTPVYERLAADIASTETDDDCDDERGRIAGAQPGSGRHSAVRRGTHPEISDRGEGLRCQNPRFRQRSRKHGVL